MHPKSVVKRVVAIALVFVCLLAVFALRSRFVSEANTEVPTVAPIIGLTKSVAEVVGLSNSDGNADPGETLEYTVTVTNTGADPATNLVVSDQLAGPQTLVGGSLVVSPIAVNDTYASIGNVGINVPDGASDLLANDINSGGGTLTIVAPVPTTSTQGGQTSFNPTTGSFTYSPPAGFEGTDTFVYTLGNGSGLTNTATVTITVSGMIWFVNNNPGACPALPCNGRLSNPFTSLALFQAVNNGGASGLNPSANDNIFIYESATAYAGGTTLLTGQRLIGQDSTSSLASITGVTPPTFSNPLPAMNTGGSAATIQNAAGNGVTLGTGNTLNGFTAGNSSGSSILGSSFGTITVSNAIINTNGSALSLTTGTFAGTGFSSITSTGGSNNVSLTGVTGTVPLGSGALSGATGTAFNVSGGTAAITYSGTISKTAAGSLAIIGSHSTGNITLSGNLTCNTSCSGVSVSNNPSGTIGFSGATKTLNTGVNTAINLSANTGATINFSNGGLDIDTTSGVGFLATGGGIVSVTTGANPNTIDSTTGTALNVANTTIGAPGLIFQRISTNGGTKGLILNTTGSSGGLTVTGTGTTDGSGGTIQNTDTRGAELISTSNLSLKNMNFANANDLNDGGLVGSCEDLIITGCNSAIYMSGVTGFATLDNLNITGTMVENGITAINVANFTFDNSLIDSAGNEVHESGIEAQNLSGAATISNTEIRFSETDSLSVVNTNTPLNLTISGSIFRDTQTVSPGGATNTNGEGGLQFRTFGTGTSTINVTNSSFLRLRTQGIQVFSNDTSTVNLNITGSTIDAQADIGTGIDINADDTSTLDFNITGNPTIQSRGGAAVNITSFVSGHIEGRVNNNSDIEVLGGPGIPIRVVAQETSNTIVLVDNNTVSNVNGTEDTVIDVQSRFQTARADVTITRNTVTAEPTGVAGINLISGSSTPGEANITCGDIGGTGLGNNVTNAIGNTLRAFRVRVSDLSNTNRLYLEGFSVDTATTWGSRGNLPNVPAEVAISLTGTAVAPNSPPGGLCQAVDTPTVFRNDEINDKSRDESILADSNFAITGENLYTLLKNNNAVAYRPRGLGPVNLESTAETIATVIHPESTNQYLELINTSLFLRAIVSKLQAELVNAGSDRTFVAAELVTRLAEIISPTTYAQEPESGETVTTAAFTLPAGEAVTVKFRVTVDNGPYASGLDSITNTANVTADGGTNVNSNQTSINLDAAPDLIVTKTDSSTTTEPGVMIAYSLTYSNATAINGQHAGSVVLTETVPANTTFNVGASTVGWGGPGCVNGAAAGTVCTLNVGAVNAGAAASNAVFTVNVPALLPAGIIQVANTSTSAENPANFNGTDRNTTDNTASDMTNIIGNWNGSASTDWNDPANWSNNVLPPAGNNISVPDVANEPVVTSQDVEVNLLTLNENLTIGPGRTVFTTGDVTLNASIVDGDDGTLELDVDSALSRTTGQVNTTLIKNFGGPELFTYHVGTTGEYSPVGVDITAGTGTLSVKTNTEPAPAVPALPANSLQRHWTLEGSGITADVTFHYLQTDIVGMEAAYRAVRVTGTNAMVFPNVSPCPGAGQVCVDPEANTIFVGGLTSFSHWSATQLVPTAADVSVTGRVITQNGRGISGAILSLTDMAGNTMHARTSSFGYYRFMGIQAGGTYIISVRSKRYTFSPRLVSVNDELTDVNFVAEPE